MKVKNLNELWLLNRTTSDVSLGDLGVKVPAGKAVNVYHVNPYLTTAQVAASREIGSLSKRLVTRTLIVVKRAVKDLPQVIKNIRASKGTTIKAVKTKSSVVLEPEMDVGEESGEGFEFADYGVVDIGPSVQQVKQEDGIIVATATQDEDGEQDHGVQLKPTLESGISKQSQIVMRAAQEAMMDPTGPHAEASVPTQSFTVVKPPKPPEPEPEGISPTGQTVSKDESGAVVVGNEKKPRSIRTVKKAQEEDGKDDYTLKGDDEVGANEVIKFQKTKYDSKVATKTKDGAVIMKLKEDEDKPEVKKVMTKKAIPSKKKNK